MATILAVGIAVLDIVNHVEGFPHEDDEVRAVAQELRRGGNAANTLEVLTYLGHHCALAATLADDAAGARLADDLSALGIDLHCIRRVAAGRTPVSYVTLNRDNGSRTIVHFRDLPELDHTHFAALDLRAYEWLHFEGRNVEETGRMLATTRRRFPHLPISLEVEKPRAGIESLFEHADLLLFSRTFAAARGYGDGRAFVSAMAQRLPGSRICCAWGAEGAYGCEPGDASFHVPAHPPEQVIDTLGAGDTFNAGVIDALLRRRTLREALDDANRLAGRKCSQQGFEGLGRSTAPREEDTSRE